MEWWQWLLVITGGFFLAIFFVVYFGWMYLKYRLSKWGKSFKAGLMSMAHPVIPQTMNLTPPTEPLQESPALRAAVEAVRALGFETAGPFVVAEGPGVVIYTSADPARQSRERSVGSEQSGARGFRFNSCGRFQHHAHDIAGYRF